MYSCTGNCMQMWLPFLAVVNVLRIMYFFSLSHHLSSPSLLIFWAPHLFAPSHSSFISSHYPLPHLIFCQFYTSPFDSSIPFYLFQASLIAEFLPLISEAFPSQALVQLYSLALHPFLPLLVLCLCPFMNGWKQYSDEGHYEGAWVLMVGPSCQYSSHWQMCNPWKRSPFIPSESTDVRQSRGGK